MELKLPSTRDLHQSVSPPPPSFLRFNRYSQTHVLVWKLFQASLVRISSLEYRRRHQSLVCATYTALRREFFYSVVGAVWIPVMVGGCVWAESSVVLMERNRERFPGGFCFRLGPRSAPHLLPSRSNNISRPLIARAPLSCAVAYSLKQ